MILNLNELGGLDLHVIVISVSLSTHEAQSSSTEANSNTAEAATEENDSYSDKEVRSELINHLKSKAASCHVIYINGEI
jgi:hypothetical protein